MPRKMGELGCSGPEARERLKRYLRLGLEGYSKDETIPMTDKHRKFVKDMIEALANNPNFEPTYGQVTYMADLYERYCL